MDFTVAKLHTAQRTATQGHTGWDRGTHDDVDEGERMFVNHTSDKGLRSKTHKELLQLQSKPQTVLLTMGRGLRWIFL